MCRARDEEDGQSPELRIRSISYVNQPARQRELSAGLLKLRRVPANFSDGIIGLSTVIRVRQVCDLRVPDGPRCCQLHSVLSNEIPNLRRRPKTGIMLHWVEFECSVPGVEPIGKG